MEPIRSKEGFRRWATNHWGDKWYEHDDLFTSYDLEDLCSNFPEYEDRFRSNYSRLFGVDAKYPYIFSRDDLDYHDVCERAKDEITGIKSSVNRDVNRTDENIEQMTIQGHYAELFLINEYGYTDCNLKYHDLIDSNNNITEIKAGSESYVDKCLKIANTEEWQGWNKSTRFIGFIVKDNKYYLKHNVLLNRNIV